MFNNTTIGKTLKTLCWVVVSAVVSYAIKVLADLDWGQFAVLSPVVNTVLVMVKNLADSNVPNI